MQPADERLQQAVEIYSGFVREMLRRLNAVSSSLDEIRANPDHPSNWQNCDFCWIQFRKVCEYLALGIVAAHHFDGDGIEDLSKWRPKELLGEIAKLNDHPTPVAIASEFREGANNERQIVPIARPIRPGLISEVYGRCSNLLHVGSLDRILKNGMPPYEIQCAESWLKGLGGILSNHVLLMPGINHVIVCSSWNGDAQFFALGSESIAVFDMTDLPEFEFQ